MDGILPLYKPRGMTSADCVYQLRKILKTRKIGHSGTLDPNVDGVLPICVGQATKTVPLLVASGKIYTGEVTLGFATTTEDLDGEEVARDFPAAPFTEAQVDTAMAQFLGKIQQIPPMFSAVKINGKRLYEYARAGETVERPVREVTLTEFKRTSAAIFDATEKVQRFRFEVACSKGTYVRTLAVDVGRKLGVPAVMSQLTRQQSGGFTLAQTHTLAEVRESMAQQQLASVLLPLETALTQYPLLELSQQQWEIVQHGAALKVDETAPELALSYQGHVKALYQQAEPNLYKAKMMLLQNNGISD